MELPVDAASCFWAAMDSRCAPVNLIFGANPPENNVSLFIFGRIRIVSWFEFARWVGLCRPAAGLILGEPGLLAPPFVFSSHDSNFILESDLVNRFIGSVFQFWLRVVIAAHTLASLSFAHRSSSSDSGPPGAPEGQDLSKIAYVAQACIFCKKRHLKCDGMTPVRVPHKTTKVHHSHRARSPFRLGPAML